MEVLVDRIAGLDVHKETVMACVRMPGEDGKRRQVVREFSTFTAELVRLRDWLAARGGDAGGDGGHRGVLASGLACARRPVGVGVDVGQRSACEELAGPQDRCVGLGVAGAVGRVRTAAGLVSCRRR